MRRSGTHTTGEPPSHSMDREFMEASPGKEGDGEFALAPKDGGVEKDRGQAEHRASGGEDKGAVHQEAPSTGDAKDRCVRRDLSEPAIRRSLEGCTLVASNHISVMGD